MTQVWAVQAGELVRRSAVHDDTFVMDTTRPDASNTGLAVAGLSYSDLTVYSGDMNISADNTVIDGYLIRGGVKLTGNNITLRNCLIVGRTFSSYYAGAAVTTTGTGNVIENCEITLWDWTTSTDNTTYYMNGIDASGTLLVSRNNIHDTIDGIDPTAGTVEAAGNYIHDLTFRDDDQDHATDATHPYWTHNDGIQFSGGTNHYIHGNTIHAVYSSNTGMFATVDPDYFYGQCSLIQARLSVITGLRIEYNWISGGHLGLNYSSPNYSGNTCSLLGNRFTPDQQGYSGGGDWPCQIYVHPNTGWTVTGADMCVYSDDSDTPAEWRGQPLQASSVSGDGTATLWRFNPNLHPA